MTDQLKEIRELNDELKSLWEDEKTILDELKTGFDDSTAETKQEVDRIDARIDELDVRMQKARLSSEKGDLDLEQPEVKAWEKLVRQGPGALNEDEMKFIRLTQEDGTEKKTMTVGDDTTGGFLAPVEIINQIIAGIVELSPIRSIANVRPTSFYSVKAPKITQRTGAAWVGEVDTRAETQNMKFGKEEISTRELSAMADISRQDLEDAAVSIDQLVLDDFALQFAVTEGTAFVSGDGVDGKPEGFTTASDQGYLGANGVQTVVTGASTTIGGDDLIELYYTPKTDYARNGTWVMNRATVKVVRKLKETSTDNYLWQPGLAMLAPPTILDRPYIEAIDMVGPSSGTTYVAAGLPVAFGDFKRAYWIIDRLAIQTLRDPYTQAGNGYIRFWARKRVGGAVVLPEAIKLLRVSS